MITIIYYCTLWIALFLQESGLIYSPKHEFKLFRLASWITGILKISFNLNWQETDESNNEMDVHSDVVTDVWPKQAALDIKLQAIKAL